MAARGRDQRVKNSAAGSIGDASLAGFAERPSSGQDANKIHPVKSSGSSKIGSCTCVVCMCEFDLCESEGVLEMGSLLCVVLLVLARGTRSFIYIYTVCSSIYICSTSRQHCILLGYVLLYVLV